MTNKEYILKHLQSIFPEEQTNTEILKATGVQPHQQVFQITQSLKDQGVISGHQLGRVWYFKAKPASEPGEPVTINTLNDSKRPVNKHARFETQARRLFSEKFNCHLSPGYVEKIPKKWDMVSQYQQIVGDAKYYTLVDGTRLPPAKFSTIAEHVWLLEKTFAQTKFLVFGNQVEVPQLWLERYGHLARDVHFYFLDDDEKITQLK